MVRRAFAHNLCKNAPVNLAPTTGVTARGRGRRFLSSSICSGIPGFIDCIADKLQIQYCVVGIVFLGAYQAPL